MPQKSPPSMQRLLKNHWFSKLSCLWILGGALGAAAHAQALPEKVPQGTKLVIADQNENLRTLLTASGELAKYSSQVQFANFIGGPAILEAFRAGALDAAIVGNTPPIQAHAAGEDLRIVVARTRTAAQYQLLSRPGAPIATLQALKGKKIAYAEGTAAQAFVLGALRAANLKPRDVKLVPLRLADVPAAVRTGQVDIGPISEPNASRFVRDYGAAQVRGLPESAYAGLPLTTSYIYASKKALADPAKQAALREFVQGFIQAGQWANANPELWANEFYVKKQSLSSEDALAVAAREGVSSFPLLRDMVSRQQSVIDLIFEAGDLPKRLDAKEEFDLRFDSVIASAQAGSVEQKTAQASTRNHTTGSTPVAK